MLRDAKFDVVDVVVNVSNTELKRAIRKFEYEADQSDIAVVFYAGHGLEISGANYLIPIDAKLASDRDADDEAITLDRLVSSADGASKLRVIILDACRDNPFTGLMRSNRKNNARVVSSGLGKIEPSSTDTLIAYAAKAGSTAEDGSDGQHSPFTQRHPETSDHPRPRYPAGLRPHPRRCDARYRLAPGAFRLRVAWRRQHLAGAGAEGPGHPGAATSRRTTNWLPGLVH